MAELPHIWHKLFPLALEFTEFICTAQSQSHCFHQPFSDCHLHSSFSSTSLEALNREKKCSLLFFIPIIAFTTVAQIIFKISIILVEGYVGGWVDG